MTKKNETKGIPLGRAILRSCLCPNPGQDQLHGRGVRVHNVGKKTFNCTACGTEKQKPSEVVTPVADVG